MEKSELIYGEMFVIKFKNEILISHNKREFKLLKNQKILPIQITNSKKAKTKTITPRSKKWLSTMGEIKTILYEKKVIHYIMHY